MKSFGDTLRELRTAQDLGLRETATKVGISPAYLSRIERGKERPPSPEFIKALARVLAADPDVLFRLSSSTDPEVSEFLQGHPEILKFVRFLKDQGISDRDIERLRIFAAELMNSRTESDQILPPGSMREQAESRRMNVIPSSRASTWQHHSAAAEANKGLPSWYVSFIRPTGTSDRP
jgi:HTH-type transcriptional regulator, competence development regulator